jgi:hypothetical protein
MEGYFEKEQPVPSEVDPVIAQKRHETEEASDCEVGEIPPFTQHEIRFVLVNERDDLVPVYSPILITSVIG